MPKAMARHILVKTEAEATALKKRIAAGEAFDVLARKYSTCPSGKKGGDLGEVRPGQMVRSIDQVEAHATASLQTTQTSFARAEDSQQFIRRMADLLHAARAEVNGPNLLAHDKPRQTGFRRKRDMHGRVAPRVHCD